MKKIVTFLLLIMLAGLTVQAGASQYRLNETAINEMFDQAEVVDFYSAQGMGSMFDVTGAPTSFLSAEKNPGVAFALAWVIGYLGIHRAYLGTSTGTIVAYILTGGGCGVVWVVDWVVLLIGLIDDDISKYIDNPKFFMW